MVFNFTKNFSLFIFSSLIFLKRPLDLFINVSKFSTVTSFIKSEWSVSILPKSLFDWLTRFSRSDSIAIFPAIGNANSDPKWSVP